jgi:DNA polymerase-4
LKVRFAGFHTVTRSATSADVVDLATDLLAVATPMLAQIDPTPGVRLLGLSGSNLGPPARQLSFDGFDGLGESAEGGGTSADWASATGAMDAIRERFGTAAIGPASALESGRIRVVRPGAQQWGPDQRPE